LRSLLAPARDIEIGDKPSRCNFSFANHLVPAFRMNPILKLGIDLQGADEGKSLDQSDPEVSTAVNEMDLVTQQNAAMVEESTAATNRLAEEASTLARLITRFRLDGASLAPRAIGHDSRPVASPARALGQKLAGAFGGGRAATAAVAKEWEEF